MQPHARTETCKAVTAAICGIIILCQLSIECVSSHWGMSHQQNKLLLLAWKLRSSLSCNTCLIIPPSAVSKEDICCRADSPEGPAPAEPACAGPLLSDETETVDGQGHSEVPSGGQVQQQGQPSAAVPTVSQAPAQQQALEPSVQGQPPVAPASVQSRSSPLLVGPAQSTAVSPVDGQGGASGSAVLKRQAQHSAVGQLHHSLPAPASGLGQGQLAAALTDDHQEGQLTAAIPAQPVQEQEQPALASADSQGKGQVLDMVPVVWEPVADSSRKSSNEALVSNVAKVEAAHSAQPAGPVQGSNATEAGGSVATAVQAEAATAGSNLHRGIAGPLAAPAQCAALANGHSSAPQAAQAAAAISSALEAALHSAAGHGAEPHAGPAASIGAMPAPAGAQAQGEAAAAAQAQGAAALAATAAKSAANAVGGVAPQVAHGQGTGLHVAAESAAHAAQAFADLPAPVGDVGAGVDPLVPPHTMQAEGGPADPAPTLPPITSTTCQWSSGYCSSNPCCAPKRRLRGSPKSLQASCTAGLSSGSRLYRSCRDTCHSCRCPYGTSCSPRWRYTPQCCSKCSGTAPCRQCSESFSKQGMAPKGWPGADSDSGAAKSVGFACPSWLLGSQCCWSSSVQESAQCLVSKASEHCLFCPVSSRNIYPWNDRSPRQTR